MLGSLWKKLKNFLFDNKIRFNYLVRLGLFNRMSDERFLKIKYRVMMGKKLNLENPKTFNEKLQYLKLYDRKPEYTMMVDKYEVKQYVSKKIGQEYIIPTLGVWNSFDEINFDNLPNQFVLKCTHDSGGLIICKDKTKLDIAAAKKKIEKSLRRNYYLHGREWPYKDVVPRIIAEKLIVPNQAVELFDYKLQCFDGKVDNILVCAGRNSKEGVKYYYFDPQWNYLNYCISNGQPLGDVALLKPKKLNKIIELAELLSEGMKQVRVDFYSFDEVIYFGEMTFFTQSGYDLTISPEADCILGEKIVL